MVTLATPYAMFCVVPHLKSTPSLHSPVLLTRIHSICMEVNECLYKKINNWPQCACVQRINVRAVSTIITWACVQ